MFVRICHYVCVFTLLGLGGLGSGLGLEDAYAMKLLVDDVMVHPGKPGILKARLINEGESGEQGVPGKTVRFHVQGQSAGAAVTDQTGQAVVEFTTHMRGNQVINGVVESEGTPQNVGAVGNFASWERRRPLLLVELETVLKGQKSLKQVGKTLSLTQTIEHLGLPDEQAPVELTKLGEYYYNIIYLYHEEGLHYDAVRLWLQEHHFPPGITRMVKPGGDALLEFLISVKTQGWDNIEAGVGLTKNFAEVLVKNRISTVILGSDASGEKFPRRTIFVPAWNKIRRYL